MTEDEIVTMFRETTPDSTGLTPAQFDALYDDMEMPAPVSNGLKQLFEKRAMWAR